MAVEDAVVDQVLALVVQVAGPARTPPGAGPDTRLWGGGFFLDSIQLLHVMLACDQSFPDSSAPRRQITPAELATIGSLAAAMRERLPR
jgi:hypothetical protein